MMNPQPLHPSAHRIITLAFFFAAVTVPLLPADAQPASPPTKSIVNPVLTRHPSNGRYFMYSTPCEAIYLAGTHHSYNIQDFSILKPNFQFADEYPPNGAPNANFIRGWTWEGYIWDTSSGTISPLVFKRAADNLFDLRTVNPDYVERLKDRATTAANEGMFMSIQLFQGWSVDLIVGVNAWPAHPFDLGNNNEGIDADLNQDDKGIELHSLQINPVPGSTVDTRIAQRQEAYVNYIVDQLSDKPNILWEISNESHTNSFLWQKDVAAKIKRREATLGKQHLVWISAPRMNPKSYNASVNNRTLFESPEAEVVSPTRQAPAVKANGTEVYPFSPDTYWTNPPATSGGKIVILDTDHLDAECHQCSREWVWKVFTRGYHIALLDEDALPNPGKRAAVREAIRQTIDYSERIRLVGMAPQSEDSSTPCSTRYCLYSSSDPDPQPYAPAVPDGKEYLVLKPGGQAQATLSGVPAGDYSGEWKNIDSDAASSISLFRHNGGSLTLAPPLAWGTAPAALRLRRSGIVSICN